jgi:hypothetical protein
MKETQWKKNLTKKHKDLLALEVEAADDACCRICLAFEPDPRGVEPLRCLGIEQEVWRVSPTWM